jgi:hypothetical protein
VWLAIGGRRVGLILRDNIGRWQRGVASSHAPAKMDGALTAASLTAGRVSAAVVKNDKNVRAEFASGPGIIAAARPDF